MLCRSHCDRHSGQQGFDATCIPVYTQWQGKHLLPSYCICFTLLHRSTKNDCLLQQRLLVITSRRPSRNRRLRSATFVYISIGKINGDAQKNGSQECWGVLMMGARNS